MKIPWIATATLLLLGSVAKPQELANQSNILSVTGDAEIKVVPNHVVISLGVKRGAEACPRRGLKTTRPSEAFSPPTTPFRSIQQMFKPTSFK